MRAGNCWRRGIVLPSVLKAEGEGTRAMRVSSLALLAPTLATHIINQGDDPFGSYVRGAEYIGSPEKGYLRSMITSLPAFPSIPLQAEDYDKLRPQLADPAKLRALLVENRVALDVNGLSVSPGEAEESLLTLAGQAKEKISDKIKEAVHYRSKLPTRAEAIRRLHLSLDRLAQVDDLEGEFVRRAHATFAAHPEYAPYVAILVTALPSTFEHDVLSFLEDFFVEANSYDGEVADKLRRAIAQIQRNHEIFPPGYYAKLTTAIARPDNAIPRFSR